jgi:hypothetical protein
MNEIPATYKNKPLIHSWEYRAMDGAALGHVGRYEDEDGKKEIIPYFKLNGSGWKPGIELIPRPLFGLERLAAHPKDGKAIFIVEGEKAAAALHSLGITAVSSLGGSQAASKADWTPLNGIKTAFLVPDNDPPGEHYIKDVYQCLMALEQPPKVKVLRLDGLSEAGDIVDWLQNLSPDWNGYSAFPESEKAWAVSELKAELKKAEDVAQEWQKEKPASSEQKPSATPLKVVSIAELLTHSFPEREPVLAPVFNLGSINMIYSWRGIGKTHTALGIAYAGASGSAFWTWTATRPFKTLLIDGEMPGESLQTRLAEIVNANDKEAAEGFFRIATIDLNEGMMPDLSTLGGQMAIEDSCLEAELIVLDNLSCLCRSGRENEAESWLSIAEWAMRMRSLGKCIIFIHHAGKDGNQRGTSKREDILDVVIELKRPADYQADQGARFIVTFPKARHLTGNDAQPFEAMLQQIDGKQQWTTKAASESTYDQVVELANLGMSQNEIAKEIGINKSNVCRAWNKAVSEGLIKHPKREKPGKKAPQWRADVDE